MTVGKDNQRAHRPNTGWMGIVESVIRDLTMCRNRE